MNDFIKFENVYYSYDDTSDDEDNSEVSVSVPHMALENVSFTVKKGEFIAIAGRNGSGKSTIARLMNALLDPSEGVVFVDGIDTSDDEKIWEIRSNVGMVFQNPDNQIVGMSVEEDIAFGLENLGVPRDEMISKIDECLKIVKLEAERKTEPHLLSGGQKQRVAIAGVLAMRPSCIVLDEATAMLDPDGRREVISTIHKLNKENGITIILITHHMDEIVHADKVMIINEGHLLCEGTPKEIFARKDLIDRAGLELPQTARMFAELNECGFEIDKNILTVDEAFEYIGNLISSGRMNGGNENVD
ncbi:MAG: energy-coupling factor transporter ATPase [Clostridia bacterium]|nr:energy-coupling factor transporter ATPase [Clostridia bacterium]